MFLPTYPKEETIGDPRIFCGREKELELLLNWTEQIPGKKAKSRALMGTKKMGKTAVLQRLYNILFVRQGPVIPFYFHVDEQNTPLGTFAGLFYTLFLTQYFAFKLNRKIPVYSEVVLFLNNIIHL